MKLPRMRISTLMLLVVIAGLAVTVVIDRRRIRELEAEAQGAKPIVLLPLVTARFAPDTLTQPIPDKSR